MDIFDLKRMKKEKLTSDVLEGLELRINDFINEF